MPTRIFNSPAFRWAMLTPCVILGASIASFTVGILGSITMSRYVELDSLFTKLYSGLACGMVFGATWVYIPFKIAPKYQTQAAFIAFIALLVFLGVTAHMNYLHADYWYILHNASAVTGSALTYYRMKPKMGFSAKIPQSAQNN